MAKKKGLVAPSTSEMCPPGYHIVHGHERICHSGTATWVDTHVRKNHGKIRPGLLKENILFLYWNSKQKFSSLNAIYGFSDGAEFDSVIQFWLNYWKVQGVSFPKDLDPLVIKTIIAFESSFNPSAQSKTSTAAGLMQILDPTLRMLGGYPNEKKWIEVRTNLIHVEKKDKLDPVVSIALGTRLFGQKFAEIKAKDKQTLFETIRRYHYAGAAGDEYAKKILELCDKSRKK